MPRIRFEPAEEQQHVEAHTLKAHDPSKEAQDVEGHIFRTGKAPTEDAQGGAG